MADEAARRVLVGLALLVAVVVDPVWLRLVEVLLSVFCSSLNAI